MYPHLQNNIIWKKILFEKEKNSTYNCTTEWHTAIKKLTNPQAYILTWANFRNKLLSEVLNWSVQKIDCNSETCASGLWVVTAAELEREKLNSDCCSRASANQLWAVAGTALQPCTIWGTPDQVNQVEHLRVGLIRESSVRPSDFFLPSLEIRDPYILNNIV
jgi:hypothetical protein